MIGFRPIHVQIRDYIQTKIESGEYKPGDRLPTEKELTEKFQTSKSPVRQALDGLRIEGLIYRHPGRGTFVSPIHEHNPAWTFGSIQDVIGWGSQTRLQIHHFFPSQISEEAKELFGAKQGQEFFNMQGVRFLEDKPVAYLNIFIPQYIGAQLHEEDLHDSPIILLLERKLHIPIKKCIQSISASLAGEKLAPHLEISKESAVSVIERLYYSNNEELIELAQSFWNPQTFKYRSILSRR